MSLLAVDLPLTIRILPSVLSHCCRAYQCVQSQSSGKGFSFTFQGKMAVNVVRKRLHVIIHIDLDAYYASIEQRDFPHLRGKPVIVGGSPDRRGVVSTA